MKYLLDTHTFIWYFDQNVKLPDKMKEIVLNPKNAIYISTASLWEIGIKISIGKIDLFFEELITRAENAGFVFLQIKKEYIQRILDIPFIHRDPFDRLLIATAIYEQMTIITADDNIHKYDVAWVW